MPDLIAQSIERLRSAGVRLDRGLSDEKVWQVQNRLEFAFGPEHREFLQSALPVGESWPNWRTDSDEALRGRLDWPIEGVVFDVHNDRFWPASWGDRPEGRNDLEPEARAHLARVPRLVPIFSHRYLTVDPQFNPSHSFRFIRPTSSTTAMTSWTTSLASSGSRPAIRRPLAPMCRSGRTLRRVPRTLICRPLVGMTARTAADPVTPQRRTLSAEEADD